MAQEKTKNPLEDGLEIEMAFPNTEGLEFLWQKDSQEIHINPLLADYLGYAEDKALPIFAALDEKSQQILLTERELMASSETSAMRNIFFIDAQGAKRIVYGYLSRWDEGISGIKKKKNADGQNSETNEDFIFRGFPLDALKGDTPPSNAVLYQIFFDMATGFVASKDAAYHEHIKRSLFALASYCGADRLLLCRANPHEKTFLCEYEWRRTEALPSLVGQVKDRSLLAALQAKHKDKKGYVSLDSAKIKAPKLKAWLDKAQIRSLYTAPLIQGEDCLGFLAMAWQTPQDKLQEAFVRILQQASQILADALANLDRLQTKDQTIQGFQGLIRDIPGAVFQYDWKNQSFDYLSSRIESISGYPSNKIIGQKAMHHAFLLGEDQAQSFYEEMNRELKEEGHYEIDYDLVRQNGSRRHIEEKGRGYYDEHGQLQHIVGILMDTTEEHYAKERLRSLATVIEQSSDVIVFKDTSLKIVATNSSFLKMRGLSSMDEIMGRSIEEIYAGESNENLLLQGSMEDERAQKLLPGEEIQQDETWYTRAGQARIMSVQRFPLYDEEYVLLGTGLIAHDVTEQRKIEEKLLISMNRYKGLLENLDEIVFALDEGGHINYITPNCLRKLGFSAQDTLGKSFLDLAQEKDSRSLRRMLNKAFLGERLEVEFSPKKHPDMVLLVQGIPVQGETGVQGMRGTIRDITVVKNEEIRRKESERNFRSFFETMTDMVFVCTKEGIILHANRRAHRLLGYSGKWLGQRSFWSLLTSTDCRLAQREIDDLSPEKAAELECQLLKKDGGSLVSRMNIWPGRWRNQECIFIICKDIRKEKAALKKYNRLFDFNPIPISLHEQKDMRFVEANQAMLELLGVDKGELIGQEPCSLAKYLQADKISDVTEILKKTGHIESYEIKLQNVRGEDLEILLSVEPMEEGDQTFFLTNMVDITEQNKAKRAVHYMSVHDHLTRLHNRRHMHAARQEVDREENLPLAVIYVDVNGLKLINDAFGHKKGDELLLMVADILREVASPLDEVARMGGDEFLMFCPHTDHEAADVKMDKILKLSKKAHIEPLILSLAVGSDVKKDPSESFDTIIENADAMMYRNKLRFGRQMRYQTISTVLDILHADYNREELHADRVARYAEMVALELGMSTEAANTVKACGLLHDIGKIVVPPEILNKPGGLSGDEYEVVMRHTEAGYQILRSTEEYMTAADVALHHHEWWNGQGYPEGLQGYQLSLTVRIITVADAFDMMIGDYPYRPKMSIKEASQELRRASGSQFDPRVVDALLAVIDRGDIS